MPMAYHPGGQTGPVSRSGDGPSAKTRRSRTGAAGLVLGRGGWILAAEALAGGVVELHQIRSVDVTVPSAPRDHDKATGVKRHALVALVVEQLDGDGSLQCEEQLVGVGVHLPGSGPFTVGSEDGELAAVERDELVERHLLIGVRDVDGPVSFHDGIIVRSNELPTRRYPIAGDRGHARLVLSPSFSDILRAGTVRQWRRPRSGLGVRFPGILAGALGSDPTRRGSGRPHTRVVWQFNGRDRRRQRQVTAVRRGCEAAATVLLGMYRLTVPRVCARSGTRSWRGQYGAGCGAIRHRRARQGRGRRCCRCP